MANEYKKPIVVIETAYSWRAAQLHQEARVPSLRHPRASATSSTRCAEVVAATPNGLGQGVFWWEPAVRGPLARPRPLRRRRQLTARAACLRRLHGSQRPRTDAYGAAEYRVARPPPRPARRRRHDSPQLYRPASPPLCPRAAARRRTPTVTSTPPRPEQPRSPSPQSSARQRNPSGQTIGGQLAVPHPRRQALAPGHGRVPLFALPRRRLGSRNPQDEGRAASRSSPPTSSGFTTKQIEGQFDWSGQRDLRRFVELCAQARHVRLSAHRPLGARAKSATAACPTGC